MSDYKDLNLYQKLLKITEEIGKIEKTGKNSMQGYAFIEQANVVAELRPQLSKYGVFIIPETISRTVERFENKKGTITVHSNVKSRYTVINADNPEEKFVSEWDAGEALDTSDKATNKATTASHKYYLMKLFNISDKDDADKDSPKLSGTRQHPVNTDLTKAKHELFSQFQAHDITTPEKIREYLTEVIGKEEVTTVNEAKAVLKTLENKTDNEVQS